MLLFTRAGDGLNIYIKSIHVNYCRIEMIILLLLYYFKHVVPLHARGKSTRWRHVLSSRQ